ncbi:TPA: hypothetical protein O4B81_000025 [Staphylococcus aureus]|nr:DUF5677 domain-containing protein [Staphylococcus aureus]HCU8958344.1 hypothetical protein [Staphylococcus aureus]HCZ8202526.1 hypothetical protein [Staphylococcus aureus]HDI7538925.1 hypothetical protein [Staphylococcus aureus]HDI7541006.1 hypothetical protein [Staphylococcus aureus]
MEKLFFKNFDLIKLINLIEGHINKKLTTDNDIEEFKENYLFLSVYEIVHSFYLNYIDINNCITISSTRTLVRKSYELLLQLKYILEYQEESNIRAKRYFLYKNYQKIDLLISNGKDSTFDEQTLNKLKMEKKHIEKSYVDSFINSNIKVNKFKDIKAWYMEKSNDCTKTGNLYELSEYLNMNYQYKHIYKNFCKDVHSTDSIINDTIRFFGKNIAIRNGEIEELLNEEPLTSEIEISSFTNYIVSEFLKCSSLFLNDKKLWEDYSTEFEKYYNQKWYS